MGGCCAACWSKDEMVAVEKVLSPSGLELIVICFPSLALPCDKSSNSYLVFPLTLLFCLSFYCPLLLLCPMYTLEVNLVSVFDCI